MIRVDSNMHADMVGEDAPLVCAVCGGEQEIEQTTHDPLMWVGDPDDPETLECDGCKELREGWAQECAYTRWEDEQR